MTDTTATAAIASLVAEIGRHLASLSGPGISEVLDSFDRWSGGSVDPVASSANHVIQTYLGSALAAMSDRALASAIAAAAPFLPWITYDLYDRLLIGDSFAGGHAFAPVIGGSAPLAADNYDLGLFLIAPGVFYRDHKHRAPELYAPLTGPHGWRFAPGDPLEWKPAGEPVWNPPFQPHATMAGSVPFLCIYVWTADVNEPAAVVFAPDWAKIEGERRQT